MKAVAPASAPFLRRPPIPETSAASSKCFVTFESTPAFLAIFIKENVSIAVLAKAGIPTLTKLGSPPSASIVCLDSPACKSKLAPAAPATKPPPV